MNVVLAWVQTYFVDHASYSVARTQDRPQCIVLIALREGLWFVLENPAHYNYPGVLKLIYIYLLLEFE